MVDATEGGGQIPPVHHGVVERRRQEQWRAANFANQRRRPLVGIGAPAVGPIAQSGTERHVLQADFLNVGAEPATNLQIVVTRDTDGRMRFYVELTTAALSFLAMEPTPGAMCYFDGAEWVRLTAPDVPSVLLHDTTTPVWSPI